MSKQNSNLPKNKGINTLEFLPTTLEEMQQKNWAELDVLLIGGDAYVDHPSFGIAILGRYLESLGLNVGVITQPDIKNPSDFLRLGTPRLFVGITAGAVDSMLNNYTANKKPRSDDQYSPGGKGGNRPDYTSIVYSKIARQVFPDSLILVGGVEASLRRLAHYDYWQNKVKPSILMDMDVDFLIFGMGEKPLSEIIPLLVRETKGQQSVISKQHFSFPKLCAQIKKIRGVGYLSTQEEVRNIEHRLTLPSFSEISTEKKKFAKTALLIEQEANPFSAKTLIQSQGKKVVVINPPSYPLSTKELDAIYNLPFTKLPHPSYTEKIPAFEMIQHSLTAMRGCAGGCSFCAITLHQGKLIQSRSEQSILSEIKELVKMPHFKGYISDIGGPSANMYKFECSNPVAKKYCRKTSCVYPNICPNFTINHAPQIKLLKQAQEIPGIKRIHISSGIRYDVCLADKKNGLAYLTQVIANHVSGQLKVAPEHVSSDILSLMRKPSIDIFDKFMGFFYDKTKAIGKEQYLVPYFISGFPGSTTEHMEEVYLYLKQKNWKVQQVQGFIPTPMTIATAMYFTNINPYTKEDLYVAKSFRDRKLQQALLQPQKQFHKKILSKHRR